MDQELAPENGAAADDYLSSQEYLHLRSEFEFRSALRNLANGVDGETEATLAQVLARRLVHELDPRTKARIVNVFPESAPEDGGDVLALPRSSFALPPEVEIERAFEGLGELPHEASSLTIPSSPYLDELHLLLSWSTEMCVRRRRAAEAVLDVADEDHGKLLWNGKPIRYQVGGLDWRSVTETNNEGRRLLNLIATGKPPHDLSSTALSKALAYLRQETALGRDGFRGALGRGREVSLNIEFSLSDRLRSRWKPRLAR